MPNSICILTDSTAQFPQLGVSRAEPCQGCDLWHPGEWAMMYEEGQEFKTNNLPQSANEVLHPRLIAPSVAKIPREFYLSLNASITRIFSPSSPLPT